MYKGKNSLKAVSAHIVEQEAVQNYNTIISRFVNDFDWSGIIHKWCRMVRQPTGLVGRHSRQFIGGSRHRIARVHDTLSGEFERG